MGNYNDALSTYRHEIEVNFKKKNGFKYITK